MSCVLVTLNVNKDDDDVIENKGIFLGLVYVLISSSYDGTVQYFR